jgi:hypothetical protein
MSVFVHYDRAGKIHSFVTFNAPEGGAMSLTPKPGLLVSEIEGLQPPSNPADHAAFRDLAKTHVVDTTHRVTLLKRR